MSATEWNLTVTVEPDHPALAGHFPGNPVVPGVVILDALIQALEREISGVFEVVGIPVVKFLNPLPPGVEMRVRVQQDTGNMMRFQGSTGAIAIISGNIECRWQKENSQ
jgi:3-hydroxymyristoyl/3-hydroxydecanoyl-(acyl carrier protein) dehydratase